MLLPPLPNLLFQRDPYVLDLRRRHHQPHGQAGSSGPETIILETIYRFHPMFTADGGITECSYGGSDEDWGHVTIARAATFMALGNGRSP